MPQRRSMAKRMRQALKRRERNRTVRTRVRGETRKALAAIAAGDLEAAQSAADEARRQTDRAVSKGVLHRRTAARRKRRLYKHFRTGSVPAEVVAPPSEPEAETAEDETQDEPEADDE